MVIFSRFRWDERWSQGRSEAVQLFDLVAADKFLDCDLITRPAVVDDQSRRFHSCRYKASERAGSIERS